MGTTYQGNNIVISKFGNINQSGKYLRNSTTTVKLIL